MLQGTLFLDGSLKYPQVDGLQRGGWSVVQADRFGSLEFAAYGAAPHDIVQQTRDNCEDYAAFMASKLTLPSRFLSLHIDCSGTLSQLRDPIAAAVPSRPRRHFWSQISSAWAQPLTHAKVKAHASGEDVARRPPTHWEKWSRHARNVAGACRRVHGARCSPA